VFSVAYSRINIGIRHILPVYVGFSILAASGLMELLHLRLVKWGLALAGWLVVSSWTAHPDYLAYFNEIGGGHPERIVIDSDLDWGQDMKRLAVRLRGLHVDEFRLSPFNLPGALICQTPKNAPNGYRTCDSGVVRSSHHVAKSSGTRATTLRSACTILAGLD